MHLCTLCPERKNINSDKDLSDHLNSKLHKRRLQKYYKDQKEELTKRIELFKQKRAKKLIGHTRRYKKLAMLSLHFRLQAQL